MEIEAVKEAIQDIMEGPGKFEMMVSLFDKKEVELSTIPRNLKGNLNITEKRTVVFVAVEREDGTHDKWIFKATQLFKNQQSKDLIGFYDAKRRKGWLQEVKKGHGDTWTCFHKKQ